MGDPDHISCEYAQVMPVALTLVKEPKRVLIVGLGGGTIPGLLRKHYPQMTIDVVDIDPDVVDVAKKFFGFHEDAAMHAYVEDGRRFIEKCKQPYDIIFLDAFGPDNIPYDLATKEFLVAVRRAVGPKGVVASNVWSSASNSLHDAMLRTYQDVFDDLYVVKARTRGNEIFLALPRKTPLERDELAAGHAALQGNGLPLRHRRIRHRRFPPRRRQRSPGAGPARQGQAARGIEVAHQPARTKFCKVGAASSSAHRSAISNHHTRDAFAKSGHFNDCGTPLFGGSFYPDAPGPDTPRRTAKSGVRSIFRRERMKFTRNRCPKTWT